MSRDEKIEVEMILVHRAGGAVLFEDIETDEKVWLPYSEISIDPPDAEPTEQVTVTMPEWLATDRGLI